MHGFGLRTFGGGVYDFIFAADRCGFVSPTPSEAQSSSRDPASAAQVPSSGSNYVVARGDTLGSIARRFGVTVQALASANGISDPSRIFPGQALVIPGAGSPAAQAASPQLPSQPSAAPSSGGQTYVVQGGDTLFRIAQRFGVTVQALSSANGISDPARIFPGQTLIIP